MRGRLSRLLAATTLSFGLLSGAASATDVPDVEVPPPNSEQGPDMFAVGGGKTIGEVTFDFSAHDRPHQDASDFGHVNMMTGETHVRVRVDCVVVHGPGKRATISGVVTHVVGPPLPTIFAPAGQRQHVFVEDGGEPSSGPVDDFFTSPGTEQCGNLVVNTGALNNVTQGNIVIK